MGLISSLVTRAGQAVQSALATALQPAMDDARARALGELTALYEGRQYEGRNLYPSWDKAPPNAHRTPLRMQKPSVQYDLPKLIVNRATALLFGEGRFPEIHFDAADTGQDAPEVTAWLAAIAEEGALQQHALTWARQTCAAGSGCLTWAIVDGEFDFRPLRAATCTPTFDPRRAGKLIALEQRYRFTRQDTALEGGVRVTRAVEYWHRETWDLETHVVFEDVKVGDGTEPVWTVADTVEHHLGFVPAVWAKAIDDGESATVDGISLLDGLGDMVEDIDRTLSQKSRAVRYNQEPERIVYGEIPKREGGATGTTNVQAKDKGGAVELLEMDGNGQRVAEEHVGAQRNRTLETARVVSPDTDKLLAAARSGAALRILHAPTLELVGELRAGGIGRGLREVLNQILSAARAGILQRLGTLATQLPAVIPLGKVKLMWGRFFDPTPEDLAAVATTAVALEANAIIDRETLTRWVAREFGFKDVDAILERLEAQRDEAQQNLAATMQGLGGPAPGGTPPGTPNGAPAQTGAGAEPADGADDQSDDPEA